jgi:energy-coupling factor transporter transmembrane protein EcfT
MGLFLYREADTVLHRLDARTKILGLLVIFTVALLFSQPALQASWLVALLGLAVLGRCLPNLKKLWVLLLLLFLYCLVLWPLFVKGPLAGTVAFSLAMGLRLDVMVIAGVVVLSTTRVEDFTAGLQRLGLPAPMAFACSLAFRWVPAFLSTAHAVVQAQQARGLDLQGGNVVARAGRYVPLMIPMMTHVIRQTLLLAMALEAKGFDPRATRASAGESRFTAPDYAVLAGLAVLLLLCLWLRWNGYGVVEGVGF